MNQDPKRHHYIPEFFLRRWCVEGVLTRYVRTRRGIYCKKHSPKAVAFRTDLYKLQGVGVGDPYSIEKHTYQQLDSETAPIIAKLLSGQRVAPTDDEQVTLSLFLLALPARNPWSLIDAEAMARAAHMAELNADPEIAAKLKLPAGQRLFEAIEKALPHLMADQTRRILVKVWADHRKVLRLLNMDWFLRDLSGASTDLILSDRVLVRHGDLLNGRCVLVLPLSPKHLLFASSIHQFATNIAHKSDDEVVRMTNIDSAYQAKDHIFGTGIQHKRLAEHYLTNEGRSP